jgi:hypothetical protein
MVEGVVGGKRLSLGGSVEGSITTAPDPTYAFDDGQPSSNFNTGDFRDKDNVKGSIAFHVSLVDDLTYPGAARFGDVVFDQSTRIDIVEGHGQRRFSMRI